MQTSGRVIDDCASGAVVRKAFGTSEMLLGFSLLGLINTLTLFKVFSERNSCYECDKIQMTANDT